MLLWIQPSLINTVTGIMTFLLLLTTLSYLGLVRIITFQPFVYIYILLRFRHLWTLR